jgi:hypothetical protein
MVMEMSHDYSLDLQETETIAHNGVLSDLTNCALEMNASSSSYVQSQRPRLRNKGFSLLNTSKSLG